MTTTEPAEEQIQSSSDAASPPRRPRRTMRVGVGVLLTLAVVALGATVVRAVPKKLVSDPVGAPAPDFTLPLLDPGNLRLSSLRGSPVVLNFWASWCGPCKDEAPVLADGWRRWKDRGVVFLGVDARDSKRWARDFMKHYGQGYRSVFDAGGGIMARYGVTGFPETFFIDRSGVIRGKWVGPIKSADLDAQITAIQG